MIIPRYKLVLKLIEKNQILQITNMDNVSDNFFDQIKGRYWYAKYFDRVIIIDRQTGYINATKLCLQEHKSYGNWVQNKKIKLLMNNFEPQNKTTYYGTCYTIKGNNSDEIRKKYTGTYIHSELFPHLIYWLDKNKNDNILFIYVMTNNYLEPQNIYKIGITKRTLDVPLKFINKTRHYSEYYFVKILYTCNNSKTIDFILRYDLQKYRENSTYFKCNLEIIEEKFKQKHFKKLF